MPKEPPIAYGSFAALSRLRMTECARIGARSQCFLFAAPLRLVAPRDADVASFALGNQE